MADITITRTDKGAYEQTLTCHNTDAAKRPCTAVTA